MKKIYLLILISSFICPQTLAAEKNVTAHLKPKEIPSVNIYKTNGDTLDIKSLQGKPLIISFWSKNCRPCIRGLKSLNNFASIAKKEKQINTIMLSPSTEWGKAEYSQEMLSKYGAPNLTSYIDKNRKLSTKLGIPSTPHMIIINSSGKEIARIRGGANWDKKEVMQYIYNIIDNQPNKS